MVLEALNGIDLALAEAEDARSRAATKEASPFCPGNNHIFVNAVAPDQEADPADVAGHMRELMDRFQVCPKFCKKKRDEDVDADVDANHSKEGREFAMILLVAYLCETKTPPPLQENIKKSKSCVSKAW